METRETITLDARAQQRVLVLAHVLAGDLDTGEAAACLRLSPRQVARLAGRLRTEGAAGLVHGSRGRRPANRVDGTVRGAIVEQALATYAGFNPVHLAESLAEADPAVPSPRTVQRILAEAGIAPPRTRRPPAHRSRRERMPKAGMLLQADGSRHDWLEGRGPWLTLVAGIDDANGAVTGGGVPGGGGRRGLLRGAAPGRPAPRPAARAVHGPLGRVRQGPRPAADPRGAARRAAQPDPGRPGARRARGPLGRGPQPRGEGAGRAPLGHAPGPPRVRAAAARRRHPRRRRGAVRLVPAPPRPPVRGRGGGRGAGLRPWPPGLPPEAVLCFEHPRRAERDATVGCDGGALALPRRRGGAGWAGRRVVVQERLDGGLWARGGLELHPLAAAPPTAPVLRARGLRRVPELVEPPEPRVPATDRAPSAASARRPPADHPWRRHTAIRPR